MKNLVQFLIVLILPLDLAFAQDAVFYQGRLLNASQEPVLKDNLVLQVYVKSKIGDCILLSESHAIDTTQSRGHFSIPITKGTSTQGHSGVSLSNIWSSIRTTSCDGLAGETVSLQGSATEIGLGRKILIGIKENYGGISFSAIEWFPEEDIGLTPVAQVAHTSLKAQDLAIAGDVDQYLKWNVATDKWEAGNLEANAVPNLDAGKITSGLLPLTRGGTGAGDAVSALNNLLPSQSGKSGHVLSTDGTNPSWIAAPGGLVTSVAGRTGAVVLAAGDVSGLATSATTDTTNASNISSGILNIARIPVGTVAGTVAAGDDSRFSDARAPIGSAGGDLSGSYPNPTVARIQGQAVSATLPGADQVLQFSAGSWQPGYFGLGSLRTTVGLVQVASASCGANQTLTWSAITDQISCQNINITNTQITGLGLLATKDFVDLANDTIGTLDADKLPEASVSQGGIMTRVAQSIAGVKTFVNDIIMQGNLTVTGAVEADHVKLAKDPSVLCTPANEGVVRYTSGSTKQLQVCDGSDWLTAEMPKNCPPNYVRVPALGGYTAKDFCVAKYEMKDAGVAVSEPIGAPWTGIPRGQNAADSSGAWYKCRALGSGYDLISNAQWQTIARNIANVDANWSDGVAYGNGSINRGHSDNTPPDVLQATANDNDACIGTEQVCSSGIWNSQRRTHVLSNDAVIWDFSGNAAEWVRDTNFSDSTISGVQISSTMNSEVQSKFGTDQFCIIPGSSDYCGFGRFARQSGPKAIIRGGAHFNTINAGIFNADATLSISDPGASHIGFRCVFEP